MKTTFGRSGASLRSATPLSILFLGFAAGCGDTPTELYRGDPDQGTDPVVYTDGDAGSDPGNYPGADPGTDPGTDPGPDPVDPNAGAGCALVWSSGFEQGFPGEWLNYDDGSYSANGTMPSGRVAAWTIVDDASGEPVYSGSHSYKGWIVNSAGASHRAYPSLHTDIQTPLINTFMVYLDADYGQMSSSDWIHFGTWGNADGQGGGEWALHTMSVRDGRLEFAHTAPHSGEYIGPSPVSDFPVGRWVRFTVYIHYQGTDGFVQVWQDGLPVLRAQVSVLGNHPGTKVTRAHWGMYASPGTSQGIQYNDDIRIWRLDAPLTDLETEPDCYAGP